MRDHEREEQALNVLAMKESLDRAMEQAHGRPFTTSMLADMSALALLATLAPNDIRFEYHGIVEREETATPSTDFKFMEDDEVLVYDRYCFAIPLPGIVTKVSTENDGVEVRLLQSNNKSFPVGAPVLGARPTTKADSSRR